MPKKCDPLDYHQEEIKNTLPEYFGIDCKYSGWKSASMRFSIKKNENAPSPWAIEFRPENSKHIVAESLIGLLLNPHAKADFDYIVKGKTKELLYYLELSLAHFGQEEYEVLVDIEPIEVLARYDELMGVEREPEYGEYDLLQILFLEEDDSVIFKLTRKDTAKKWQNESSFLLDDLLPQRDRPKNYRVSGLD